MQVLGGEEMNSITPKENRVLDIIWWFGMSALTMGDEYLIGCENNSDTGDIQILRFLEV